MKQEELHFRTILQWIIDICAVVCGASLALFVFRKIPGASLSEISDRELILFSALVYSFLFFWKMDDRSGRAIRTFVFWLLMRHLVLLIVLFLYLIRLSSGQKRLLLCLIVPAFTYVSILVFYFVMRFILKRGYQKSGLGTRTILITSPDKLSFAQTLLEGEDTWQFRIKAIFLVRSPMEEEEESVRRISSDKTCQILDPKELHSYLMTEPVGLAVFYLDQEQMTNALPLLSMIRKESIGIMISQESDMSDFAEEGLHYARIENTDFMVLNTRTRRERSLFIKRIVDILIGACGTILMLIVSVFAVILIKTTSHGPVFEKNVCIGLDGKRYTARCFRTRYTGTRLKKTMLAKRNTLPVNGSYLTDDTLDITRGGHILRRLHLANLPLMLSVFVGDMSFVGVNRMTEEDFIGHEQIYRKCLYCKPGILCPPGSKRPAVCDPFTEESIMPDILYAKNWSLWMDVVTIMDGFRHRYEMKNRLRI